MTVATPTSDQCNMTLMHKCVVDKLSAHWEMVCDYMEYSVSERNRFRCGDDKSSLSAVLDDWIGREGETKTWSMFVDVLNEIDELSALTDEICSDLKSEGVVITSKLLLLC